MTRGGYTVTSLSYVVSLLPPDLVRDLRLEQHGYHVYPQGPYFAPRVDGRCLRLPDDPAARHAEIAKYSAADADAYDGYEAHLQRIGRLVGPLLHQIPPHLGSRGPRTCAQARPLTVAAVVTGIPGRNPSSARSSPTAGRSVGRNAAPAGAAPSPVRPGSKSRGAVNYAREGLDVTTGRMGPGTWRISWPRRVSCSRCRRRRTGPRNLGRALGHVLDLSGPGRRSDPWPAARRATRSVITTAHPQISFLRLLDTADLPPEFVADIRRWQTRSGTVRSPRAATGCGCTRAARRT